MQEDVLTVYYLYGFKWLPEKRYALSRFCGTYSRVKYSRLGVGSDETRLVGREGDRDVWLLKAGLLLRGNRQTAEETTRQISLATGLPLLEYIEPSGEAA